MIHSAQITQAVSAMRKARAGAAASKAASSTVLAFEANGGGYHKPGKPVTLPAYVPMRPLSVIIETVKVEVK